MNCAKIPFHSFEELLRFSRVYRPDSGIRDPPQSSFWPLLPCAFKSRRLLTTVQALRYSQGEDFSYEIEYCVYPQGNGDLCVTSHQVSFPDGSLGMFYDPSKSLSFSLLSCPVSPHPPFLPCRIFICVYISGVLALWCTP